MAFRANRHHPNRVPHICAPFKVLLVASVFVACAASAGVGAGAAVAKTPKCFGAAARDRAHPCVNPTRSIVPSLATRDNPPSASPCRAIASSTYPAVCRFGARGKTKGAIALVGDSHALHWRGALQFVADAKHVRGYSLTQPGCYYSAVAGLLPSGIRGTCVPWNRAVVKWLRRHPEVSTVFVSQASTASVLAPPGVTQGEIKVNGFQRAWRALPKTVKRVIVLRDIPISYSGTFTCIRDVLAAGIQQPGPACRLARWFALRFDAATSAVEGLASKRYRVADLTDFFCDPLLYCYPVVGGVLTHRNVDHMTILYSKTLGPYLLRRVRRQMAVG